MSVVALMFYISGIVVLIFSLLAVTSRRLLRAAVYLLFSLVGVAIFYLVMDFMFLAAVQVVVYVGGIVVLFIFSILLTSHIGEKLEKVRPVVLITSGSVALLAAIGVISILNDISFQPVESVPDYTVAIIGRQLLNYERNGYVLPFEVISILLLAAMVAAIVIAKRKKSPSDD